MFEKTPLCRKKTKFSKNCSQIFFKVQDSWHPWFKSKESSQYFECKRNHEWNLVTYDKLQQTYIIKETNI
jgi:hypothetical protein